MQSNRRELAHSTTSYSHQPPFRTSTFLFNRCNHFEHCLHPLKHLTAHAHSATCVDCCMQASVRHILSGCGQHSPGIKLHLPVTWGGGCRGCTPHQLLCCSHSTAGCKPDNNSEPCGMRAILLLLLLLERTLGMMLTCWPVHQCSPRMREVRVFHSVMLEARYAVHAYSDGDVLWVRMNLLLMFLLTDCSGFLAL